MESSGLQTAPKLAIRPEREYMAKPRGQNYLLPSGGNICYPSMRDGNPKNSSKRRTIQICTDSQAALMAIESSKVKSRLVLDCKKILNDLASCNRVILTWVPGHLGVPGNEEADRLARVGSIGYPIGPENILGVPYSMGVSTMKELLNKEFEKSWQEAPDRIERNTLYLPYASIQFWMAALFFFALVLEVGIYCWYGHKVMIKSREVGDACYMTNWYEADVKIQKILFIIMERSKRPIQFTAGGFFTLSLPTLTKILRTAYSYFALLQHTYGK
ncbi:hypothetical protein NQ318_016317 [Aromia moschata]|uniref:RNase H type-1 domain-containing protein n=1 Tax=Aromia moschata TaxID=1265417 RepID=A0AAV8Z5X5_9CUCU|nr:hypothetical protein NQ318_016317 [Aromia moschata]